MRASNPVQLLGIGQFLAQKKVAAEPRHLLYPFSNPASVSQSARVGRCAGQAVGGPHEPVIGVRRPGWSIN